MRHLLMGVMCCLTAIYALPGWAQSFLPGSYAPSIPTLETTVGHASGAKITPPEEIEAYFNTLAEAAPDRMRLVPYATSWQGRQLFYAIISASENMERLDDIQADLGRLASGERLQVDALVAGTPAVTWLSYGVHGDEISSPDAAAALAYHLLAAENDETVETILSETIIVIDPMQNPDGRARFVHSFTSAFGLAALDDRYTAEHDQPWPRGRFNHYLFDMNRDWFALTQPETRGRVQAMLEWNPVVVVDAHEMGGDQTYFFAPSAEPFNPNVTDAQREKQDLIGRNNARWFDAMGFSYFTREVYDAFYPGYGDMWPTLNGAIAMTYEQASARGLRFRRRDDSLLTFKDGVRHHFISTLATAETVARNKTLFLSDYARYRAEAVAAGTRAPDRYYVLDLAHRRWQTERLGQRLAAQGIDVRRLTRADSLCGKDYENGALVIDTAQPNGRLIRTLLDRDTRLPEGFVAEQNARRDRGLRHELYDVTAWSLPLMDDVAMNTCRRVDLSTAQQVTPENGVTAIKAPKAAFGYALPWSDAGQAKFVLAALSEGLIGKATSEAFTKDGREFPKGTTLFTTAANDEALFETLSRLADATGGEFVALETGWVDKGPNYGSAKFRTLKLPRVAMAWGEGTRPTSVGATRYVLERELGLPVSPIRVRTLGQAELNRYDVVILADSDSGFLDTLGKAGASALRAFVDDGGVLISFAGSTAALTNEALALLSTSREYKHSAGEPAAEANDEAEDTPSRVPGEVIKTTDQYDAFKADTEETPDEVPGVLVNLVADPDHWLASGYDRATALFRGRDIFQPLNTADGTNVFRFEGGDNLVASGYLWTDVQPQIAYKPYLMVEPKGDGLVIAFTQSPTTRGYLNGLTLLLTNAVLFGPAQAR